MQESSHCSICGWDWLLLFGVLLAFSLLASHDAFPVALFSQLLHDKAGAEWQINAATALARPHRCHIYLLLDHFYVVPFVPLVNQEPRCGGVWQKEMNCWDKLASFIKLLCFMCLLHQERFGLKLPLQAL